MDGTIDYSLAIDINAPDQIGALPAAALLEGLRFRIDPNKAEGTTASAGFVVTDTDESIGLTIRNGVVETNTTIPNDADFVAELPKLVVMGMLFEDSTAVLTKAFDSGSGKLPRGSLDDAARFFAYFDPKDTGHVHLSDR
ncbi:alkyl sulfatase C-terminal domain-containing protein [Rhodococcus erythropolis]